MENTIVRNYKITKLIGKGSFGTVYESVDKSNNTFALKIEEINSTDKSQLETEYRIYHLLQKYPEMPRLYFYGTQDSFSYLVLEKLETSLSNILDKNKFISLKSVAMVAKRIINILRIVHENGYVYRDMKPENIMIKDGKVFLIDYGMCKKYIRNGIHIDMVNNKVLTGTARYASINTHKGYEQSRRDDLEGLGYVLIFSLQGSLPWMGIPAPTRKEKYNKIGEVKENTSSANLVRELPGNECFAVYLEYCRTLQFEQEPDYLYLIGLFDGLMRRYGVIDDDDFDWTGTQESNVENKKEGWGKMKDFFGL